MREIQAGKSQTAAIAMGKEKVRLRHVHSSFKGSDLRWFLKLGDGGDDGTRR